MENGKNSPYPEEQIFQEVMSILNATPLPDSNPETSSIESKTEITPAGSRNSISFDAEGLEAFVG